MTDTENFFDSGLPFEVCHLLGGTSIVERSNTRRAYLVGLGEPLLPVYTEGRYNVAGIRARFKHLGFDLDHKQVQRVVSHVKKLRANARLWEREEQRSRAGLTWANSWRDGPRYDY